MKRFLLAAALAGMAAPPVAAQQARLALRPQLGVFTAAFPLVAVADGYHRSIQLGTAPAAGLDIEYALSKRISVYGGIAAVFTRLHHSGIMELADADGDHSSRATLLAPTAGVIFAPALLGSSVQPSVRLGAGVKVYSFELHHTGSPVVDPTADIGIGFTAGQGPVAIFTEARWLPSRFDARFLPIRATERYRQWQNDWMLQIGFRARP